MGLNRISRAFLAATCCGAAVLAATSAMAAAQHQQFNLSAQPAATGVREFARQAGLLILVSAGSVENTRTNAVKGDLGIDEALRRLIDGTGLTVVSNDGRTIILARPAAPAPKAVPVLYPVTRAATLAAGEAPAAEVAANVGPQPVAIEQVVVTARRREESVQDVPVSVTALSGATLLQKSVTDVLQLGQVAPSVVMIPANGRAGLPVPRIRSLAETSGNISQDPTVGVYFAEAVINRLQGFGRALYDIDSVQVLKGPQGTLFGRSTTGGALLISPARPRFTDQGYISATIARFDRRDVEMMANTSFGDTFAIRFAASFGRRDGGSTNLATGDNLGGERTNNMRFGALWRPTDTFENYLVIDYGEFRGTGTPWVQYQVNAASAQAAAYPLVADLARQKQIGIDNVYQNFPARADNDTKGVTDIAQFKVGGDVTLKNIANFRETRSSDRLDFDATESPVDGFGSDLHAQQYSEELQLLGNSFDKRLDWIVGLYYFAETSRQTISQYLSGTALSQVNDVKMPNTSKAIYAQATFAITPKWHFTAGGRYTSDSRGIVARAFNGAGTCLVVNDAKVPYPNCTRTEKVTYGEPTYNLSIDYRPTQDLMFYIAHRRGYRSGGFNSLAANPIEFTPYAAEFVSDVEGGLKGDWAIGTGRLRTNLAIFYGAYTDIQRAIIVPLASGGLGNSIFNAAKANIKGGELEVTYIPTADLQIDGFLAQSKARYTDFANNGVDYRGKAFALSPDYMARIGARYRLRVIPDNVGELHVDAGYRWQSKYFFADNPNPLFPTQSAFGIADARLDWDNVAGKPLTISLFVTNLFDKRYIQALSNLYGILGFASANYNERRVFGLTARYNFGG